MTCAQVGVNIGPAKGIDRLLGVANQEQAGIGAVVFDPVNGLEDAVLNGIGVLKLVDQGHRELFANQGGQALAAFGLQCSVEAQQHVVKAHLGATAFFLFKAHADPVRRMLQNRGVGRWQGIERSFEALHGVEPRMLRGRALPGFGHAVGGQTREAGPEVELLLSVVSSPGAELFKPGLEIAGLHFATVDGFARHGLQADIP